MWDYCKNKDFQQNSLVPQAKNVALCTATHPSGKS